jgi:hypothetical protein
VPKLCGAGGFMPNRRPQPLNCHCTNKPNPHPTPSPALAAAARRPTYRIEFIGDSVLTGWGSRFGMGATPLPGGVATCGDPLFDGLSNSFSFGAKLCRTVDAECRFIAWTGAFLDPNRRAGIDPKVCAVWHRGKCALRAWEAPMGDY